MKVKKQTENSVLITFDESVDKMIADGWVGDEKSARVFWLGNNVAPSEIRVYKNNGESYVLPRNSKDEMTSYKYDVLLRFAKLHRN